MWGTVRQGPRAPRQLHRGFPAAARRRPARRSRRPTHQHAGAGVARAVCLAPALWAPQIVRVLQAEQPLGALLVPVWLAVLGGHGAPPPDGRRTCIVPQRRPVSVRGAVRGPRLKRGRSGRARGQAILGCSSLRERRHLAGCPAGAARVRGRCRRRRSSARCLRRTGWHTRCPGCSARPTRWEGRGTAPTARPRARAGCRDEPGGCCNRPPPNLHQEGLPRRARVACIALKAAAASGNMHGQKGSPAGQRQMPVRWLHTPTKLQFHRHDWLSWGGGLRGTSGCL